MFLNGLPRGWDSQENQPWTHQTKLERALKIQVAETNSRNFTSKCKRKVTLWPDSRVEKNFEEGFNIVTTILSQKERYLDEILEFKRAIECFQVTWGKVEKNSEGILSKWELTSEASIWRNWTNSVRESWKELWRNSFLDQNYKQKHVSQVAWGKVEKSSEVLSSKMTSPIRHNLISFLCRKKLKRNLKNSFLRSYSFNFPTIQ